MNTADLTAYEQVVIDSITEGFGLLSDTFIILFVVYILFRMFFYVFSDWLDTRARRELRKQRLEALDADN